jgi:hypothetical protein
MLGFVDFSLPAVKSSLKACEGCKTTCNDIEKKKQHLYLLFFYMLIR